MGGLVPHTTRLATLIVSRHQRRTARLHLCIRSAASEEGDAHAPTTTTTASHARLLAQIDFKRRLTFALLSTGVLIWLPMIAAASSARSIVVGVYALGEASGIQRLRIPPVLQPSLEVAAVAALVLPALMAAASAALAACCRLSAAAVSQLPLPQEEAVGRALAAAIAPRTFHQQHVGFPFTVLLLSSAYLLSIVLPHWVRIPAWRRQWDGKAETSGRRPFGPSVAEDWGLLVGRVALLLVWLWVSLFQHSSERRRWCVEPIVTLTALALQAVGIVANAPT